MVCKKGPFSRPLLALLTSSVIVCLYLHQPESQYQKSLNKVIADTRLNESDRPERCIVTIASLDQWLATIEKHCYQWLADWKPLKNHLSQWLSRYHSTNGNGHLKNHWFFAMVVNFRPLCLAEADIKQTNDGFWKIKDIFFSVLRQDVPWFMSSQNTK